MLMIHLPHNLKCPIMGVTKRVIFSWSFLMNHETLMWNKTAFSYCFVVAKAERQRNVLGCVYW